MTSKRRINQAGFSMIEAVLVALLMLVVFIGFGAFMLRFTKSAAEYSERSKQTADVGLTSQTVADDFEQMGLNLTISANQIFAGMIFVPFQNYDGYVLSGYRITRRRGAANGGSLISNILWKETGELSWRGSESAVTVREPNHSFRVESTGQSLLIYKNDALVIEAGRTTEESVLSIVYSATVIGSTAVCRTSIKSDGQTIYEFTGDCSDASKEITADVFVGGFIDRLSLDASEIVLRESPFLPVRLPLLPVFSANGAVNRLELPFAETANGFVIFGSDHRRDAMFLSEDVRFGEGQSQTLAVNDSDGIKTGDVLFLFDFFNYRSVLLKVIDGQSLTVEPITEVGSAQGGFGHLYSVLTDFDGFDFQPGTRLVRLTSPVEYSYQSENDIISLYRRSNGTAWELVIPNISSFSLERNVSAARASFGISFDVLSEGVESTQTAQPVRLLISPRSLNRTFDAR